MESINDLKKRSTKSNCECCGFKRTRYTKSNNKFCGIQKKPKELTVNDANAYLMKQIEELEGELMELLRQGCECHTDM